MSTDTTTPIGPSSPARPKDLSRYVAPVAVFGFLAGLVLSLAWSLGNAAMGRETGIALLVQIESSLSQFYILPALVIMSVWRLVRKEREILRDLASLLERPLYLQTRLREVEEASIEQDRRIGAYASVFAVGVILALCYLFVREAIYAMPVNEKLTYQSNFLVIAALWMGWFSPLTENFIPASATSAYAQSQTGMANWSTRKNLCGARQSLLRFAQYTASHTPHTSPSLSVC